MVDNSIFTEIIEPNSGKPFALAVISYLI